MGYLEKYRIFAPELRRSLHIAKYRNEQKSARFHIVTYIIKANAQLLDFQSKYKLERVIDQYSIKGQVKCQETGILSTWTELTVDHRQPNTFSVILDRFKELNGFDLDKIKYKSDDNNFIIFDDSNIAELFREYHKEKANLRLVRNECNSVRTSLAR